MARTDGTIAHTIAELLGVLLSMLYIWLQEIVFLFVRRPRKNVEAKIVLLTGAGHGIGRLIVRRFAKLGASCVLVDINQESNEATAAELRAEGHQVWAFQCDVSSQEAVGDLRQRVQQEVGFVDILINNAGVVNCKEIGEIEPARIRKTFGVNTFAHIWMIREFLPSMKERKTGHIVAISSVAGIIGTAYLTDYCSSKFAVRGLMMALAEELYTQGFDKKIHLTTICPVAINTGMFQAPYTRFAWATPILEPDTAADGVVEAILTNQVEVFLPGYIGTIHRVANGFVPQRALAVLQRFFGYGVGPHKEVAGGAQPGPAKKEL